MKERIPCPCWWSGPFLQRNEVWQRIQTWNSAPFWMIFHLPSQVDLEKIFNHEKTYMPPKSLVFFHSNSSSSPYGWSNWIQDVAVPYKIIGVIHIFGPKWSKMLKANFQPRFCLTIVVDNCSLLYTLNVCLILVSQPKHMPGWINWMNMTFKCNQSWW